MKKRVLCSIFASLMLVSALASCSNSSESSSTVSEPESSADVGEEVTEDEEPYTVYFQYMVSAESQGTDAVKQAAEDLVMEELNMHVELVPMTFGAWASNIPMMLASNEPLDLFMCYSDSFGTYIESGYIRDWAPYLDMVPDVVSELGDDLAAGYVGDFLAGFPNMKERGFLTGLVARKDIMDELGYSVDDFSMTVDDYSTFEQLDELFAAVKAAYPDMTVIGGSPCFIGSGNNYADTLGNLFGVLEDYGQTTTVTNYFESEQYRQFCEITRRWFLAGYESADAATTTDSGETLMKAGNTFSYVTNCKPNTDIEKQSQTGYEVYVIPMSDTVVTSSSAVNGMVYCLANAAENPEKAAEFYNWCFSSGEFQDLINWGIEGVDWVENEEKLAAYPDGVDITNVAYHQDFGWALPNQFAGHPWEGNEPDIWEQYRAFNDGMLRSKAFGFTFDSTVVADEIAACTSVYDQYDNDLYAGSIDTDEGLSALNEALYAAGLQTIMDEKQRQLDEWLAEQEG